MNSGPYSQLYKALIKAISFAAGMVILLWFFYKVAAVVLLVLFALVLALVINSPVAWLEGKGLKRFWACLIVFGSILIVMVGLGWLVIPKVTNEVTSLVANLPSYAAQLSRNVSSWFEDYPEVRQKIQDEGSSISEWVPSLPKTLLKIGNYSLSILSILLITILFFSMVVYAVTNPRPLLHLYFSLFPQSKHQKAARALADTSVMVVGWIRANFIGGAIRAVLMTVFLSLMNVPGAWVWGAVAFVAELIPRLGFYIASVPPILVALSISPTTALWVWIFFLALDELMADFIFPKLRSNTMNIHPVSIIFIVLAMTSAFGLMGALLATPLTAIIKAYYEAFFLDRFKMDTQLEHRIDSVLYRAKATKEKEDIGKADF